MKNGQIPTVRVNSRKIDNTTRSDADRKPVRSRIDRKPVRSRIDRKPVRDIFGLGLDIPYDRRFIRLAQDWIAQAVKTAGGNDTDAVALSLVMEEVLDFICRAYPDAEPEELIHMNFGLSADGETHTSVGNAGPPMHPNRIPEYDPAQPLESDADGLWYFVARRFCDDLEFRNMGMEGWRVVIRKRLSQWSFKETERTAKPGGPPVAPGELELRRAVPGDAAELMDLTYDTYRYTYPAPELYDEQKLYQALDAGTINSMVVAWGSIVAGNLSWTIHHDTPRCAYLCSLMVRRRFRSSAVTRMLLEAQDRLMDTNRAGVDLYTVSMVTAHTRSQKIGAKSGFSPLALLLSVGKPARYAGMSIVVDQRESFVFCGRFVKPVEPGVLYLPLRHHGIMGPLLHKAGCRAGLSRVTEVPSGAKSIFRERKDRIESHAYITVRRLGTNWTGRLRNSLFRLRSEGIACVIVLVPACRPLPPDLDTEMGGLNAVFCGVMPTSAREFFLAYCVLSHEIDFNGIHLADPLANHLKDHVHTLCTEVFSA